MEGAGRTIPDDDDDDDDDDDKNNDDVLAIFYSPTLLATSLPCGRCETSAERSSPTAAHAHNVQQE